MRTLIPKTPGIASPDRFVFSKSKVPEPRASMHMRRWAGNPSKSTTLSTRALGVSRSFHSPPSSFSRAWNCS
ncbi:MAG: hypothetical protein WBZ29_07175, partial [Methanocella sp.]